MKYLLDTHTLLWFLASNPQISRRALQLITNPLYENFISIVSLYEIAIKVSIGKLVLDKPFEELFPVQLHANHIKILDITVDSLLRLSKLPFHHRDPFILTLL